MPISTTTFLTLLQRIGRETAPVGLPQTATLTGGSTTTAAVSGLAYTDWSANAFDGIHIYIDDTTDDAAPEGEERKVTQGGFAGSTGTWTVAPAFSATVGSGDTVTFLYRFRRADILNAVNEVCSGLFIPGFLPFGPNITDIDMETSGVTNWAAVGTPGTRAKITTASRIIAGTQALHIITDASTEGAQSPTFDVTAGESIIFSVGGIGNVGGWIVRLVDMTSGSAVVLVTGTAVTEMGPTEWRFPYSVPSGTTRMAIQLIGSTSTSDFAISWAMPIFQDREWAYPQASLIDPSLIQGICYLPQGRPAPTADAYMISEDFEPWSWDEPLRDWRAANSSRIPVGRPQYPLFLKFLRQHPTLTNDTDTIYAPEDMIVKGAEALLLNSKALQQDFNAWKAGLSIDKAMVRTHAQERMSWR